MKISLLPGVLITAVPILTLSGCSSTAPMTQAEQAPMQQAPDRPQQEVRTPLPPPTATPVPPDAPPTTPPAANPGPYVRAEIGYSDARDANFRDDRAVSSDCFIAVNYPGVCGASIDSLGNSPAYTIGFGWNFGNGLRTDLSYGYRDGYDLHGYDPEGTYFDPPVTSKAIMLNVYYDLPLSWGGIRPFIGGGIGRTTNKLSPIKWFDPSSSGKLPGGTHRDTAWHFTVGAHMPIFRSLSLEFGYRYMDMGEFKKSAGADLVGQFNPPPNGTGSATGELKADEIFVGLRHHF
jgi:opacity protein-like surface antigen